MYYAYVGFEVAPAYKVRNIVHTIIHLNHRFVSRYVRYHCCVIHEIEIKPKIYYLGTMNEVNQTAAAEELSSNLTFAVIPKNTDNVFFSVVRDGCVARAALIPNVR